MNKTRKTYEIINGDVKLTDDGTIATINGYEFEEALELVPNTAIKTFYIKEAVDYIKAHNLDDTNAYVAIYDGFEEDGEIEFCSGTDYDTISNFLDNYDFDNYKVMKWLGYTAGTIEDVRKGRKHCTVIEEKDIFDFLTDGRDEDDIEDIKTRLEEIKENGHEDLDVYRREDGTRLYVEVTE